MNLKMPKIERISLWFFFLCSFSSTSQTIFGLYLRIINNWVLLGMKPACNIHSFTSFRQVSICNKPDETRRDTDFLWS